MGHRHPAERIELNARIRERNATVEAATQAHRSPHRRGVTDDEIKAHGTAQKTKAGALVFRLPSDQPEGKPRWIPADTAARMRLWEEMDQEARARRKRSRMEREWSATVEAGGEVVAYQRRRDGAPMLMLVTSDGRRVHRAADTEALRVQWEGVEIAQRVVAGWRRALDTVMRWVQWGGSRAMHEAREISFGGQLAAEFNRAMRLRTRRHTASGGSRGFGQDHGR